MNRRFLAVCVAAGAAGVAIGSAVIWNALEVLLR